MKTLNFVNYVIFSNEDSFGGDYDGIAVTLNDTLLTTFGDWYHDKGDEKADGFMEGYAMALGQKYKSKDIELAVEDPYSHESIIKAIRMKAKK